MDIEDVAAQIVAGRVSRRKRDLLDIDEAAKIAEFYWLLVAALKRFQPSESEPPKRPKRRLPDPDASRGIV